MKKNNAALGVAVGVAAIGAISASVYMYKKLSDKKKAANDSKVASVTKVISMNYPTFESLEEVYNESKLIIKGEILDTEVREVQVGAYGNGEAIAHLYTVSTVKVIKSIKGTLEAGDIIYVKQLGDGNRVIASDFNEDEYFKSGEQYYLFLDSQERDSFKIPYSTLNPHQGCFKVEDNKIKGIDLDTLKKNYLREIPVESFEKKLEEY